MKFCWNQKFWTKKNFIQYLKPLLIAQQSLPNFHPFPLAWTKVIKIQQILDNIRQYFQEILTNFTLNILGFYRI